jgi:hypothetical protein
MSIMKVQAIMYYKGANMLHTIWQIVNDDKNGDQFKI